MRFTETEKKIIYKGWLEAAIIFVITYATALTMWAQRAIDYWYVRPDGQPFSTPFWVAFCGILAVNLLVSKTPLRYLVLVALTFSEIARFFVE